MEVAILHDVTEVPIRLTISERDAVWSDSGSMEKTIIVDTNISEQNFSFEVPVIERRFIFLEKNCGICGEVCSFCCARQRNNTR